MNKDQKYKSRWDKRNKKRNKLYKRKYRELRSELDGNFSRKLGKIINVNEIKGNS